MESAGVERVIFILPSAQRDKVMPVLDKYSELIPQGEKITK